jgi:diguanylate cyclase (GGDEF)-like protein
MPSTEKDRIALTVLTGPTRGLVHKIEGSVVTVGRSEDADLVIADPNLSRVHARLVWNGHQYLVEDLGSTNGTYVGDHRITEPTPLVDGVRLGFGRRTLTKYSVQDQLEERALLSVHESALRDKLTGAYNRRVFDDRLESELAFSVRHGRPLALLLLDIDHFKSVNDTFGHQAGDWVLAQVARELQSTLRTEDVFARHGGEEFAVLLRDSTPTDAAMTGERLRAIVQASEISFGAQPLAITVSVGLGCNIPVVTDPAELVRRADSALYRAKSEGRNRIAVFGEHQEPHLRPA